jgi:predicted ATP-dependent endonuclease of OLD family
MKLKKVRITNFQSIRDSNDFEISDITCLVGKNEAGKTALLEALRRINPVNGQSGDFSVTDDYPRKDVEDYRNDVETGQIKPAIVVKAIFELDESDIKAISDVFGEDCIKTRVLELYKGYSNTRTRIFPIDEKKALDHIVSQYELVAGLSENLIQAKNLNEALAILVEAEKTENVNQLNAQLSAMKENGIASYIYTEIIKERIPQFLYFDEYYQMKGRDNIERLVTRKAQNKLEKSDYPLLGLINLARLELETLVKPGRTQELKNLLEGAGNHLTKKIVKYWSQNKHLQMRFDVRVAQPGDPENMTSGTNIWGEVYDSKHWVSTGLETRSKGFVWFFSFLAWYSDVKKQNERLILLLDEPGLFLHAKAQEDLLKYFDSELKGVHQLLYTTHSPFMVDVNNFKDVRIVQDKSIDIEEELSIDLDGTKVITDVLEATSDSLFPLQGALGYEIYQTLFIGPNCLVVEGVSDLLYLQSLSALLEKRNRIGLDKRWVITPTGGSDKVPTFVALIGANTKLNIAVLVDYQKKDQQSIENLYKSKLIHCKKVHTFTEFTKTSEADIEDLFEPEFYLKVFNLEYSSELPSEMLQKDLLNSIPRILVKIDKYLAEKGIGISSYNHFRAASYFASNIQNLEKDISELTLSRFEECFRMLNSLL